MLYNLYALKVVFSSTEKMNSFFVWLLLCPVDSAHASPQYLCVCVCVDREKQSAENEFHFKYDSIYVICFGIGLINESL